MYRLVALLGCLFLFLPQASALNIGPENVVVVANSKDRESLEIARYYMEQRGIPEANLIMIPVRRVQRLTGEEFVSEIFNPLREQLVANGWIRAVWKDETDSAGRRRMQLQGHSIGYLVLCRLPYQVSGYTEESMSAFPKPQNKTMGNSAASVDSELSLLCVTDTPLAGPVNNPLYKQKQPAPQMLANVIRVARLDGPSVAAVKRLIDSAIIGERDGLKGRGYFDLGGPHKMGDTWINTDRKLIEQQYFPVSVDETKSVFQWTDRLDAAAIYFGWWVHAPVGGFENPAYRFPPGALAIHISSFSGQNLREPNRRWGGTLVERGIAATVGNVYEPFLHFTHNTDLFLEGMVNGMTTCEAAYYALPALSWMPMFIGDPLYKPFKVTLEEQLEKLSADDPYAQYVVLREAERIRRTQGNDEAFEYERSNYHRAPGLALAYAIAKGWENRSENSKAIDQLKFVAQMPGFAPDECGLAFQISELLVKLGDRETAYKILKTLSNQATFDIEKLKFMPSAIPLASQFGDRDQAKAWQNSVNAIKQKLREKADRRKAAREANKKKN
ncbi:MAG: TIGR03790 family protein [Verrucomicrobiota bacterium]